METYIVKKPCRPDGVTYMTEGEIPLTTRQAKYLLLSGHLAPKAASTQKTAASKKATK